MRRSVGVDEPLDLRQSPARESFGFLLAVSAHRFRAKFEQALEPIGLEVRHFGILATIRHFGPVPQQQLGASVCIDRSTMVALIDDLEQRGLVRRGPDVEDRRVHRVHLTEAGIEAHQKAREILQQVENDCLQALGIEERGELKRMLQTIADLDGSAGFAHIKIKVNNSRGA